MYKFMKGFCSALALSAALYLGAPTAWGMPEILPLDEVAPGMKGRLYTVVDLSGEIVSFDADILGVYHTDNSGMPYIIARSQGAFADTDGGLMQGMSGSPVYVDGLLVGAASATISQMNPHTFLITPIEYMLPLWEMPDTKNQRRLKPIDLRAVAAAREKAAESQAAEAQKPAKEAERPAENIELLTALGTKGESQPAPEAKTESEAKAAAPASPGAAPQPAGVTAEPQGAEAIDLKTAVFVGGFDKEACRMLQQQLDPMGLRLVSLTSLGRGGSYPTVYDASLEPGDAVGAALACGDFSMTAIGTVTAVEEDRVLAFGHEFLHGGNVNYFMTDAQILGMVNGVSDGQKLGVSNQVIGRFNQDREAGIAGQLGNFPMVVPLRVTVADKTLQRERRYVSSIAYDERFLPLLSAMASYSAIGRTMDHKSESTVKVQFSIRTNAMSEGVMERTNMYYAPMDVGQIALGELAQAMSILCSDTEREVDVYDVKVRVDSEAARRTASLLTAVPEKLEVKPGETVNFKVMLKPYREEKITLTVPFTVPKWQKEGPLHLDVHGGGLATLEQLLAVLQEASQEPPVVEDEERGRMTENRLRELMESSANNDIVIEPGQGPLPTEEEQEQEIRDIFRRQEQMAEGVMEGGFGKEPEKSPKTKFATDYVIDNNISATLQILEP